MSKQINLSQLEVAFNQAASRGFKTVRMKAAGFMFRRAPDSGRNAGGIYIYTGLARDYRGKIHNGLLQPGYNWTPIELTTVQEIMANPKAMAIQFGRRTGTCAICGRHLDNKESVKLGIGPICAEKVGWLVGLVNSDANGDLL